MFHSYCCVKHNICAFGGLEQVSAPWESRMENQLNVTQNWVGEAIDIAGYLLGISETP